MGTAAVEISRVSDTSQNLLTQEGIDASRRVAERRNELRTFATSDKWKSYGKREYKLAVADSVRKICKELRIVGTTPRNGDIRRLPEFQASISRDPRSALFREPGPIYESINLVAWLRHLPEFCQQCLGQGSFFLNYRRQDCTSMADKCVMVLEIICSELQDGKEYEKHRKVVDGRPRALSKPELARIRRQLSAAVDEWHVLGVKPTTIAEELLASTLFTTELKTKDMNAIISDSKIHGKNPSLYGVMNWSVQVFRDLGKTWNDEQTKALEQTIQLFLPIFARIDVFLSRLPVYRTTLFREIRAHIPANKYKSGCLIPWMALSPATPGFVPSYELGYTLFVAHVCNAPAIGFATVHSEGADHLMPTYAWVQVVSVMSPTLLRALGLTCNYISVQSAGDVATADQLIEQLKQNEQSRMLILEKYVSRYVEASVHPAAPPLPDDANVEPLFQAIQTFLANESHQHLLLLGSSGSGKSSALLAVYCELSRQSQDDRGKPLIPIFIPLPSLGLDATGPIALDRAVSNYLGVSSLQLEEILTRCDLVVLLDSLDECGDQVKKWFPLLDGTEYCCKARVIISCRTEYFSNKVSPALDISTSSDMRACGVLHIQPFSCDQVDLLLAKASRDMTNPVTVDHMISLGIPEELLKLPIMLTMGVEIVRKQRQFGDAVDSLPFLDFVCQEKTRVGLYSAYLNTCRFLKKQELADSKAAKAVDILDAENTASLRKALQDVAITMLAQGTWRLSLSKVRIMFGKYFGKSRAAVNNALHHSPIHLESLDDPDAELSFWHKSIGEFLCAAALWGSESKRYLEMTAKGTHSAFSKRELCVLSFFNELATPAERRKKVCGEILVSAVLGSRDLRKRTGVANKEFVDFEAIIASNAMALLVISQYPLNSVDLRNLVIKDCLVFDGDFRYATLDGTYFENCDMNRSSFDGAHIEGTEFIRCTFGPVMQAPLRGHTRTVNTVCWSPDGRLIASGSNDQTVRVWEVASPSEVKKLEGHTGNVNSVCWSPDGKRVASGSADKSIRIWDVATGREVQILVGHTKDVKSVCWSPEGTFIASGSEDKTIRVWEAESGCEVQKLEGHASYINAVCWSPDGSQIVSGSLDSTVRVWEAASGFQVQNMEGHAFGVSSVCWSPDSKLVVSGSPDQTVRIWEVASGHEVKRNEDHANSTKSVSWSPDGTLIASGSADGMVHVWEIASGRVVKKFKGHSEPVFSVCWSPDAKMVASGSNDNTIRVWGLASGLEVEKLEGHTKFVKAVCWSPDGKLIASGSSDQTLRLWDIATGREVQKLAGHTGYVHSVCWSPDGKLIASGSWDKTLRVWELASGRTVKKFDRCPGSVGSVCWSPDGKQIASGSGGTAVQLWEDSSWRELKEIKGHTSYVSSVCWSPSGKLVAAGSWDGTIRVWKVLSGQGVRVFKGHTTWVNSVCWSPDGKLIASGSRDHSIRVWDVASAREVKKLEGHADSVDSVCWSPDSTLLLSGSWDKSVRVWDIASGKETKMLLGHGGWVLSVCWSPDGRLVASASADNTVRVWDLAANEGKQAARNNACPILVSELVLGRPSTRIPPFRVFGEVGLCSRSNPILSEFMFDNRPTDRDPFGKEINAVEKLLFSTMDLKDS